MVNTSEIKELRKSQAFLNPPGRPCLDQPAGNVFSFLAGLWILGSIHWAGGISRNRRGVLLTAVLPAPQLRAPGRKAGRCKPRGVAGASDPGIAAGAEAGLAEGEEQPSRERQAGSFFFQGAR